MGLLRGVGIEEGFQLLRVVVILLLGEVSFLRE
jgi:hypothetical protein